MGIHREQGTHYVTVREEADGTLTVVEDWDEENRGPLEQSGYKSEAEVEDYLEFLRQFGPIVELARTGGAA